MDSSPPTSRPNWTSLWPIDLVASRIAAVFETREAELRLEQSVYGMDSLDELALQRIIAVGLAQHFDVLRESYYPASANQTSAVKLSGRMRCDLVLTPLGKPLRLDHKPAGLFDPIDQVGPGEALWLEIKTARQYRAPGERHPGYGQQWRQAVVADIRKIEREPLIREAALVLIVFTEADWVIEKDLELFEHVLIEKEVLAGFRQERHIKIVDRIGHSRLTVAIWPTISRGPVQ